MPGLSWEEVLERKDLIRGDAESSEDGACYRGPIAKIEIEGQMILVTLSWVATLREGTWVLYAFDQSPIGVNMSVVQPHDIGNGRIMFELPLTGRCVLFPKGSNLDPKTVKGLST